MRGAAKGKKGEQVGEKIKNKKKKNKEKMRGACHVGEWGVGEGREKVGGECKKRDERGERKEKMKNK